MKKITLPALILLALTACNSEKKPKISTDNISIAATADSSKGEVSNAMPVIAFEKTVHDFGTIMQGETAEYNFKFRNTGNADLLIANAVGNCGCTVPEFSKEVVKPNGEGFIKVKFNSDLRINKFTKTVMVTTNTIPAENVLTITGFVQK